MVINNSRGGKGVEGGVNFLPYTFFFIYTFLYYFFIQYNYTIYLYIIIKIFTEKKKHPTTPPFPLYYKNNTKTLCKNIKIYFLKLPPNSPS